MVADSSILSRVMRWYKDQCNGDWEHHFGVSIDTLDNPGWQIKIDTTGTAAPLENRPKQKVDYDSDDGWAVFWVEAGAFHAAGGPDTLNLLLEKFLEHVE
jgi:hypothetical protein